MVPRTVKDDELIGALAGWKVVKQLCTGAGIEQACVGGEGKMRFGLARVGDDQARIFEAFVDNAGGVKRVEPLSAVLQNQDFGLVFDLRNRRAEAIADRPITGVATATKIGLIGGKQRRQGTAPASGWSW